MYHDQNVLTIPKLSLLNHYSWKRRRKMWHLKGMQGGQWHLDWQRKMATAALTLCCFPLISLKRNMVEIEEIGKNQLIEKTTREQGWIQNSVGRLGKPMASAVFLVIVAVYRCVYWPNLTFYSKSCTFTLL